jgi:hypothetical protein
MKKNQNVNLKDYAKIAMLETLLDDNLLSGKERMAKYTT